LPATGAFAAGVRGTRERTTLSVLRWIQRGRERGLAVLDTWRVLQPTAVVMGRTPHPGVCSALGVSRLRSSVKERPVQARGAWSGGSPDGLRGVQFDFGVTAVQDEPGTTTPVPRRWRSEASGWRRG